MLMCGERPFIQAFVFLVFFTVICPSDTNVGLPILEHFIVISGKGAQVPLMRITRTARHHSKQRRSSIRCAESPEVAPKTLWERRQQSSAFGVPIFIGVLSERAVIFMFAYPYFVPLFQVG